MSGKVVHVKKDRYDVYIGRANPRNKLKQSKWANPYFIGRDGSLEEVFDKYEKYISELIEQDKVSLDELENQILGCWCAKKGGITFDGPLICHGQILLKLLDERKYNGR